MNDEIDIGCYVCGEKEPHSKCEESSDEPLIIKVFGLTTNDQMKVKC